MSRKRKTIPLDIQKLALHEAGYRCSNPTCRTILTLDIHHLDYVSSDGSNSPENLLALCPNCHRLHHQGHIPIESLRAWKMVLLSLNEGFDRKSIDLLLAVGKAGTIYTTGDGLLACGALLASGLIKFRLYGPSPTNALSIYTYGISLSEKGHIFVEAWKEGNQQKAVDIQI